MSDWIIRPYEGLGGLYFGMGRSEAHIALGSEAESFRKAPSSTEETDAYDLLGLHLYFDEDDRLDFIEAFSPCEPKFANISLLSENAQTVLAKLESLGHEANYDDGGYFFDELGFVLYAPSEEIEAVSVYRKGYYDD